MINGNEAILRWNDEPIGCLTSNSQSEVLSFLSTSKKTLKGASTVIPIANSYTVNFEAVMVQGVAMSWPDLSALAKLMQLGTWEFDLGAMGGDAGYGFLSNLDMVAISGELITFTGTIIGYGEIVSSPITWNIWGQSPSFNVDEGGRYVIVAP